MNKQAIRKSAIEAIINAQIASDAGKGIEDLRLYSESSDVAFCTGYSTKDNFICKAIELIDKIPGCGIRYYVADSDDFGGCWIVYFKVKLEGKTYQVSFHTFSFFAVGYMSGRGDRMHWEQKYKSRKNCEAMMNILHSTF